MAQTTNPKRICLNNKPKIVRILNEIADCWIEDMGPERPQIYPRPPKKKKRIVNKFPQNRIIANMWQREQVLDK